MLKCLLDIKILDAYSFKNNKLEPHIANNNYSYSNKKK